MSVLETIKDVMDISDILKKALANPDPMNSMDALND
jgi:hypothetical protein